jgi:uridylate kinase
MNKPGALVNLVFGGDEGTLIDSGSVAGENDD